MVLDRYRGVFQLMARQDARDGLIRADDAFVPQQPQPGDTRPAGRFAAQAKAADDALGLHDGLIAHLPHDAIADIHRPQAFLEVYRPRNLNRRRHGFGPVAAGVEVAVIIVDGRLIHPSIMEADAPAFVEVVKRIGPGSVDNRHTRNPVNESQVGQFGEGLAEGAGIAEVAAGGDNPVGRMPLQAFEHAVHNRLLAFEAEGVQRVEQVQTQVPAHLLDPPHTVIEVAFNLNRLRPIVQGLAEFAVGHPPRADKHGAFHPAGVGVEGDGGGGIAGAGAGDMASAGEPGVAKGGGHAVILKRAAGIQPLVLQQQPPGVHPRVAADAVIGLQKRLALADGNAVFLIAKGQQLPEPPHARIVQRARPPRPAALEPVEARGYFHAVPVVLHIEQVPARRARKEHLVDIVRRPAGVVNTALEAMVTHRQCIGKTPDIRYDKPAC